jgi:carboxyl-terminal processing protease
MFYRASFLAIVTAFSACSHIPSNGPSNDALDLQLSFRLSCGNIYAATMSVFDRLHYKGEATNTEQELLDIGLDALPALKEGSPTQIEYEVGPNKLPLERYLNVCRYLVPHAAESAEQSGEYIEFHLAEITDSSIAATRDKRSGFELLDEGEKPDDYIEGKDNGLGARLVKIGDLFILMDVEDNLPAAQAGLKNGDLIQTINGRDTASYTHSELTDYFYKQQNDEVTFTIEREGQKIKSDFTVTLYKGEPRNVTLRSIGDVTYLKIKEFTSSALNDALNLLERKTLADGKPSKIVIDLEDNPGGETKVGYAVTDLFLPKMEGVQMISKKVSPQGSDLFVSDRGRKISYGDAEIAVLINGHSASAAEDMTGALKANNAARVYGSRSYGKGTAQTYLPIGERGIARITSQLFAPGGEEFNQCLGVEPHVKVMTQDMRDNQNHVLDPSERESCQSNSIQSSSIPPRINQNHEQTCTVKKEYSGALSTEKAESLPKHLIEYQAFLTEGGALVRGYFFKGALACALSDMGEDISQYVSSRPHNNMGRQNTRQTAPN